MRRPVLSAAAAVGVSVAAVLVTVGPVSAARDDPCADLAHRAQVDLDISHGWWVLGNTLDDLGMYDAADDAFAAADYFFAAWDVHANDPAC